MGRCNIGYCLPNQFPEHAKKLTMQIVLHRRNTVELLQNTPSYYGVEIDIRSYGNRLVLQHDPFQSGEDFEEWLSHYNHRTLVLNVKEEGLEDRIVELMKRHQIEDYFFLDMSFPFIIRKSAHGLKNIAVRYSEYESIETVVAIHSRVSWVWIDSFTCIPQRVEHYHQFQEMKLKTCVVSPELLGRTKNEISAYRDWLKQHAIRVDAVCTKNTLLWT